MSQKFSPHENFVDDEPMEAGSDRTFGCTVGGILVAVGVAKALKTGAITPVGSLIFLLGAALLLLGVVAPVCLSTPKRLWLKIGAVIAEVVNPIILGLLFFLVVTPTAVAMRLAGKRPLRLAPDRASPRYWIKRERRERAPSSMKQQF